MKALRYFILVLVLCNVASIVKVGYGSAPLGALLSALTYGGLVIYYFLSKKHSPAWLFLLFGIVYYTISGLIDVPSERDFINDFIKYVIMIVCGGELARNTTLKELFIILAIGSSSILIHATVWADNYGRYAGFYGDPNSASFVALMGCCLTYALKNEKWKLIMLFYLTFCGVLTFSRSFFLLWFLMSVIGVIQDRKNIKAIGLGFGTMILLLSLTAILQVNTSRLSMIEGLVGDSSVGETEVTEDARTETWALYYDKVFESPFFGSGYRSFCGGEFMPGVHNSYLRVVGEAGIFALMLYLAFYGFLFLKSMHTFKTEVHKPLLALSLAILLLTIHNFIIDDYITIMSLWLYFSVIKPKEEENSQEILDYT